MNFVPAARKKSLAKAARSEIDRGHQRGFNRIWPASAPPAALRRAAWEPFLVARLCASMADVARVWRPLLRGVDPSLRLDLTTVFTHQTPIVAWRSQTVGTHTIRAGRCELADILFCVIDRRTTPNLGNVVLVQAKQADGLTVVATKKEKEQFDLLSARPVFDGVAKGSPKQVDLRLRSPDCALLYGMNEPDSDPPSLPLRGCHRWMIAKNLRGRLLKYSANASQGLARTLAELLQGQVGWEFELPPAGHGWRYFETSTRRDDWSMLVNYLLEVTWSGTPALFAPRGRQGSLYLVDWSVPNSRFAIIDRENVPGATEPMDWVQPDEATATKLLWARTEEHPLSVMDRVGIPDLPPRERGIEADGDGITLIVFELSNALE